MLQTFDNTEKDHMRRLERERQMKIMEEASSVHEFALDDIEEVEIEEEYSEDGLDAEDSPKSGMFRFADQHLRPMDLPEVPEEDDRVTIYSYACYQVKRNWKWVIAIIPLIGLATGLFIHSKNNRTDATAAASTSSGIENTLRYNQMKDRLLSENISDEDALNALGSPQQRGLDWIANVDPAQLSESDEMLFQRYALSVLYFATNPSETQAQSSGWTNSDNWLSDMGTCGWYGVECLRNSNGDTQYDSNASIIGLNLANNKLTGFIPNEIRALSNLRIVDLSNNTIGKELPSGIGSLSNLKSVNLAKNSLTGSIPVSIGNLLELEDLYFNENSLNGSIPPEICKLQRLQALSLFQNKLTSTIPDQIGNLMDLYVLYLDDNLLSGPIPSSIGKLQNVADVRLRNNLLTGHIPPEIGDMFYLEILYLDTNNLTGNIPDQIGNLKYLVELHLYKNGLSGPLPNVMGNLKSLTHLYLDGNRLSGNIPESFFGLFGLESLYLFQNNFTGPLPSHFGKLTKLRNLRLSQNSFHGQVPSELGGLASLEKLHIQGNEISGAMPTQICTLNLQELISDCTVKCDCCTSCL